MNGHPTLQTGTLLSNIAIQDIISLGFGLEILDIQKLLFIEILNMSGVSYDDLSKNFSLL